MIELRWLVRTLPTFGESQPNVEKVLQFRQMSNIEELGIQAPIWTEWEDVPTKEEKLIRELEGETQGR